MRQRLAPPVRHLVLALFVVAQDPALAQVGFTARADRQAWSEAQLLQSISPSVLGELARPLAAAAHVAGSPGQGAFHDTLVAWLGRGGFEPEGATYPLPFRYHVRPGPATVRLVDDDQDGPEGGFNLLGDGLRDALDPRSRV